MQANERLAVEMLPGVESMASVVHHGPTSTMNEAYRTILTWIDQNSYRRVGPEREVLHHYNREGDQSDHITEIQMRVEKV